ncbi:MAG TPA: hypothetical protein VNT77_09535 [Allosphingosinicella sp.]|nr:hypothetical protein [Allosphingosinicella sp.]
MKQNDKKTVMVASSVTKGQAEPQFLIEHEGRLYLTLAVVDYDPDQPRFTAAQKKKLIDLRKRFHKRCDQMATMTTTKALMASPDDVSFAQIND